MIRSSFFRTTFLSALLLSPLSCGTGNSDPQTQNPDLGQNPTSEGPSIISFGTNVAELTEGQDVRFVAVVTDSGGTNQLVGGQLISPDGLIKYGAFIGSQQGSYSLDLSWALISQTKTLAFATEEKRTFVGEFYNVAGKKVSMPIELRFHCGGEPSCEGRCTTTGSICKTSTDKLCIAGACQTGCYVNKLFIADSAMSTQNTCQVCQAATSKTSLQTLPDYGACATGLTCSSGKCEVPFAKQDSKINNTLYSVVAPSAMLQVAVGSSGKIVRTTDGGANWTTINSPVTDTLYNAFALDANEIYAVGSSGAIIKSTDGGAVWIKVTSGVSTFLNGVWASGTNDVWVVGDSGTVLRSTNGGTVWTKLISTTTSSLAGVWGSGAADVYMVGASGTALRTINSGTSFTPLTTNVTNSLTAVWGSSAADVYTVGGSGTVLRSTNNGTSWTKLSPPSTTYTMNGVWGSGANNVYVVGGGGYIWRTTDSTSLTVVPSGTSFTLQGLSGTAANVFTVVGTNTPAVLRKL